MPPEITMLSSLQDVQIDNTYFNSPMSYIVTEEFGLLPLINLDLSDNNLSGNIPSTLGLLTSLQRLDLNSFNHLTDNSLDGKVPSEIGLLTSLTFLAVVSNKLTGSLPPELLNMASLEGLEINFNRFSGSVPVSGQLSNLRLLQAYKNRFSVLGSEIGLMTSLTSISLHENSLIGPLPTELGLLSALQSFSIYDNDNLIGEIPVELCSLPGLSSLRFDCTRLACPPECVCEC